MLTHDLWVSKSNNHLSYMLDIAAAGGYIFLVDETHQLKLQGLEFEKVCAALLKSLDGLTSFNSIT